MKKIVLILLLISLNLQAAYIDGVTILNSSLSTTVTSLPSITGTVTANLGTIAGVSTETTLSAINTKTPSLGQSVMSNSVPVVLASNQSAVPVSGTVTSNIGTTNGLALDTSVNSLLKPASTLSAVTTLGSITNALPTGTNSIGTVQAPTITKGTQGTAGFTVQSILDAGRTNKVFSASFTGLTTEAMVNLDPITEGVLGVASTAFTPTAGKTLRIQSLCVSTRNAGAAAQGVVINLRRSNTASVLATSPLVGTVAAGTGIGIANVAASNCISFSDGLELSNGQYFGVSTVGTGAANQKVVLFGFEY